MSASDLMMNAAECPACGAASDGRIGFKGEFCFRVCEGCGTIHTRVENHELTTTDLYDHYYDNAEFTLSSTVAGSLGRLIEACEVYRQTSNWLDVGFGEGGLLELVSDRGWNAFGSEISGRALQFGSSKGWTVTSQLESDDRFLPGTFDVITMIEFLEHVSAPGAILDSVSRLLRPGGLLYVTTPNGLSLNKRILGLDWSVFSPPEHVTIWSEEGLKRALNRAGLEVRRVRTEGLNPREMIKRLEPAQHSSVGMSRNEAAFALNDLMSKSPFRRAVKKGVNQVLTVLRCGDSLKVWAERTTA